MPPELDDLLDGACQAAREHFPPRLDIFLPGMFTAYGRRGRYPAVSLTGTECGRQCPHCAGTLLKAMRPAATPQELLALGRKLWAGGEKGMLLSGGGDARGRLPWDEMLPAIAELAAGTGLTLTAHVGIISADEALALKQAGVRQALVDVAGDDVTARGALRLPGGLGDIERTLDACGQAGLELAPHVILGLNRGRFMGEERALEMVADTKAGRVIFIVFMPLRHTPWQDAPLPPLEKAAVFIARARLRLPDWVHHLGCARPRGRYRSELDALAVRAGINALAIPSDGALETAAELGVEVRHFDTCCSLAGAPI